MSLRKGDRSIPELLTISGLVTRTGVPRTTIHFYLREGLLPRPHKSAANRSFYTQNHVELLRRVKELKEDGLALADIKTAIVDDLARIEGQDVDLIARRNKRTRTTILRVATEEFRDRGYQQTRIIDIIRKAGVSSQVFYSFFPSKAELLVESFKTLLSWSVAAVEPKLERADPGERLLRRMHAGVGVSEFESSMLSLLQAELPNGNGAELAQRVEQAWALTVAPNRLELERALKQGMAAPVHLELLAYGLHGALHNAALRASWDDKFDLEDVLATHLWLFLTVLDALGKQIDPDPHVTLYKDLIKEVATREPESPPAPEE